MVISAPQYAYVVVACGVVEADDTPQDLSLSQRLMKMRVGETIGDSDEGETEEAGTNEGGALHEVVRAGDEKLVN